MSFCTNLLSHRSYAATWGTVAFLVPTEIFPSNLRGQGNGFGITGWALGVGMTTLVNPIMFAALTVSLKPLGSFHVAEEANHHFNRAALTSSMPALICSGSPLFISVRLDTKLNINPIANNLVYPETSNRSLESIEQLFSTPSPFFWKMEQAFELHGNVLAERGFSKNDGFNDDENEPGSFEKSEEQMIA